MNLPIHTITKQAHLQKSNNKRKKKNWHLNIYKYVNDKNPKVDAQQGAVQLESETYLDQPKSIPSWINYYIKDVIIRDPLSRFTLGKNPK